MNTWNKPHWFVCASGYHDACWAFFGISFFASTSRTELRSDRKTLVNIHRTIVAANAELQGRCAVLTASQTQTAVAGSGKALLMDPRATSVWPLGRQMVVQETLRWNKFSFTNWKKKIRSGSLEWQRKKKTKLDLSVTDVSLCLHGK